MYHIINNQYEQQECVSVGPGIKVCISVTFSAYFRCARTNQDLRKTAVNRNKGMMVRNNIFGKIFHQILSAVLFVVPTAVSNLSLELRFLLENYLNIMTM